MPKASKGDRWQPAAYGSAKFDNDPVKDEWGTPPDVFHWAEEEFGDFDLDAAASSASKKCDNYLGLDNGRSGLDTINYREARRVWVNPPYSQADEFLAVAQQVLRRRLRRVEFVFLVFARTDTGWWWQHVLGRDRRTGARADGHCAARIYWHPGRIKFVDPLTGKPRLGKNGAAQSSPAPSVAIYFDSAYAGLDWPSNGVMAAG